MFLKYIVLAVPLSVFFVNAVFLRVFHGLFLRKPHKGPVSCEVGGVDYVPIVCLILRLFNEQWILYRFLCRVIKERIHRNVCV